MKIGFIGLGNVGGKLANSLLRNNYDVSVIDLDKKLMEAFVNNGANMASHPKELTEKSDIIITCLPSPKASADVMEGDNGILQAMSTGKIWCEMSTTDVEEVKRLGVLVTEKGGNAVDCPVSGGCHRAATGNISIFAGCHRKVFDKILPVLSVMGRHILHTGDLGSASILKVLTNYLATVNLVSLCEALVTAKAVDMDLATTYEAIRISSGNSFVHETESQVILNGSRDINFTMDLVVKDISLFNSIARKNNIPLEISPLLVNIFKDGVQRYGEREWSPNIIKRLEESTGLSISADGFPAEIIDDEPEVLGKEVIVKREG